MYRQIVGGPISTTDAFDPTIGTLDLSVPAVSSVMGHFVLHMLAEAKTCGVDSDFDEEEVYPGEEEAESLVINNLLGGESEFDHA